MKLTVEISDDTYELFQSALRLEHVGPNEIVDDLLNKYSKKIMAKQVGLESYIIDEEANPYYGKAKKRIARWASRPEGTPYKIIRAFLLLEQNGETTVEELKKVCCNDSKYQGVRLPDPRTFTVNLSSLKYDGAKTHGKVFDIDGGNKIRLWVETAPLIEEYKEQFIKK